MFLLIFTLFVFPFLPLTHATSCAPQTGGLYSPVPNAIIPLGQPFNLTYCSYAYFKTRTIDIDVVVWLCGDNEGDDCGEFTGGEEIAHAQKTVRGEQYGYEFNATVVQGGGRRPGQWAIGVLEHTTGYYVQGSISQTFVPVTFSDD